MSVDTSQFLRVPEGAAQEGAPAELRLAGAAAAPSSEEGERFLDIEGSHEPVAAQSFGKRRLLVLGGTLALAVLAAAALMAAKAAGTRATIVQQPGPKGAWEGVSLVAQGCTVDGGDCRKTTKCCSPGSQCYVKNEFWASCNATCQDIDTEGQGWSCVVMGPGGTLEKLRAKGKLANAGSPASSPKSRQPPMTAEICAEDGADCSSAPRCCSSSSKCFVKNEFWASCNATCKGTAKDPWRCDVIMMPEEANAQQKAAAAVATAPVPPGQECSWEGEDCTKTKCCRRKGFKCFEQAPGVWASCSDDCSKLTKFAAPGVKWSCNVLGGDQGVKTVAQAPKSIAAGTSLFCFSVVTPQGVVAPGVAPGYEQQLMGMMKSKQVGICACDAWAEYEGVRVSAGSWQSVVNTDIFNKVWQQVKADKKYAEHDWTVKVDCDAVFFPDRLKAHIIGLRPPADTPVYLHNIDFKFHFMGALEVISRKAVDLFLRNADICSKHLGHNGGEDFFTMQCLDAIKVGHMTDFALLDDKYTHGAGWNLFDVDPCKKQDIVAFHPYKAVNSWWGCYEVSVGMQQTTDFVGCSNRWAGEACSLSSNKVH